MLLFNYINIFKCHVEFHIVIIICRLHFVCKNKFVLVENCFHLCCVECEIKILLQL